MKRLLSLLLCLSLCLGLALTCLASEPEEALRFDENGAYKILILADTQDTQYPQKEMLALMNAALDAAEPDLVVFAGDQLYGSLVGKSRTSTQSAIRKTVQPVVERGLAFAVVFGNHDSEAYSRDAQLDFYRSFPGCVASDVEELSGSGTYRLPLLAHDGSRTLANLWFFDSGEYAPKGQGKYNWVQPDQNAWYLEESAACTAENGGVPIPGYAFQHIIVPEIYEALEQVPESEKNRDGVVQGFGNHSDRYYRLPDNAKGGLGEGPCPPDVNGGQFDAWKEGGDIVAAFFGHDHVNDFELNYQGIDLVNTTGLGFLIYGAGLRHGARLITLHEDDPGQYETEMLYYPELMNKSLPLGFSPTWGALIQGLVLLGVVLVLLGVGMTVLILRRRRKKRVSRSK